MAKRPNRTTIVITPDVRDGLKHIARKDQSYNQLFIDLIQLYNEHAKKSAEGFVLNQEPQTQRTLPIISPSHHARRNDSYEC